MTATVVSFSSLPLLLLVATSAVRVTLAAKSVNHGVLPGKDGGESSGLATDETKPPIYGVDVSFPIQHNLVSTNYAWLPHNVDPANNPTPPEFKDMPVNPLGDTKSAYEEFINGCVEHFGPKGYRCKQSETQRFAMSLRQPQSMQVR